jgi:hypothetical protein
MSKSVNIYIFVDPQYGFLQDNLTLEEEGSLYVGRLIVLLEQKVA